MEPCNKYVKVVKNDLESCSLESRLFPRQKRRLQRRKNGGKVHSETHQQNQNQKQNSSTITSRASSRSRLSSLSGLTSNTCSKSTPKTSSTSNSISRTRHGQHYHLIARNSTQLSPIVKVFSLVVVFISCLHGRTFAWDGLTARMKSDSHLGFDVANSESQSSINTEGNLRSRV